MGQKTNPIGNRLGIIRVGTLTGMVDVIMVINLLKTIKLENIFMLDWQRQVFLM